jgi:hypothetical protein
VDRLVLKTMAESTAKGEYQAAEPPRSLPTRWEQRVPPLLISTRALI